MRSFAKKPNLKIRSTVASLLALCLTHTASADDLLTLYQRALFSSPELQSSQFAVDIAKAQEDEAFGKLLPQVVLTGNYSENRTHYERSLIPAAGGVPAHYGQVVNSYPGQRATVSFTQPVFDLQAYLLMRSQRTKAEGSEQDLAAAHQKLIDDLVERYTDALEAIDKHQIIEDELASTEKQLKRVTAMQERQMAMITDMYQLQARVDTLRTNLIDSDNEVVVALEKLRELTGDTVTDLQPARLDVEQPKPEGFIDTWVKQAGQINPQLIGLRKAVDSAKQGISAYKAGHLPRLELQLNGTYSNTTIYNLQSGGVFDVGSAAIQATVPIYSGGITSAQVREAEAKKRYSEAQLEQKLRELENLTRAAYLDMFSSPARTQASDRQLNASEKSRDAMQKGYELGVVTIVDLLESEKQLSEARKVQRQARYRYFKARAALLNQAGRLDVEELARMNQWLVAQKTAIKPLPTPTKPNENTTSNKPVDTTENKFVPTNTEVKAIPAATGTVVTKEVATVTH